MSRVTPLLNPIHSLSRMVSGAALIALLGGAAPAVADNAGYEANCLVCHGADLKGVDQLGVSLMDSKFVREKSAAELVAFLKVGRLPDDPGSVSGGAMPGFGWIPEAELQEIAAYVKSRTAP